jgi:hypothetical protein
MSDDSNSGPESRRTERVRTLIGATAVFNNGNNRVACQIRNLSSTGAKLTLSPAVSLPGSFILEIPSRNKSYKAELRWRKQDQSGVDFSGEDPSADRDAPENQLEALKKENAILRRRVSELVARLAGLGHSERPE